MLHNLRQIADPYPARYSDLSTRRRLDTAYQLKDCLLSSSILAYKTDLVTLTDMKVNLIQQGETTICDSQIIDGNHDFLQMSILNS